MGSNQIKVGAERIHVVIATMLHGSAGSGAE